MLPKGYHERVVSTLKVNGVSLYYERHEPATGAARERPELVLLHASSDNCQVWDGQLPAFTERYRVLAVDLRGFGRSEAPEGVYSTEVYARDVVGLLETLGIQGVYLLGHSMGGSVARWAMALGSGGVEALVLANAANNRTSQPTWHQAMAALADEVEREGMSAITGRRMLRLFAPGFAHRDPDAVARYAAMRLINDPHGYARTLRNGRGQSPAPPLSSITCPVLLITGDRDPLSSLEEAHQMAAQLKDGRLVVLDNCGHVSPLERPEEFNRAVLDFLSECASLH